MADDRIDELLLRLETLERAVRELDERNSEDDRPRHHHHRCRHRHRCECHDHDHDHEGCGCGRHHRHRDRDCGCRGHDEREDRGREFDERRVVDLIVGLVAEHVEAIIARQLDRLIAAHAPTGDDSAPSDS